MSIFIDGQICEHHYSEGHTDDNFIAIDYEVLGVDKSLNQTTVYMWVLYHEYSYENGEIKLKSGAHTPTVITAKRTGKHGHYKLVEYWTPRDGSYYVDDIRAKFPWYLHGKALDSQRYIDEQLAFCNNAAEEYFSSSDNIRDVDTQTNIITSDDIDRLKANFPMYFDLDTSKGLTVYIWQLAEGSYSCGLLPVKNSGYTQEELWNLHMSSASLEEMRVIVASYFPDITKEDVIISPMYMPHSSYMYTIDDTYRKNITALFWSDFPIIQVSNYFGIIDTATFDIDGDGIEEHCELSYGPTSGLFTFTISASVNGQLKYFNIFNSPVLELSFEKNTEGQVMLIGKDSDYTRYMSMYVDNGNIVITSDEQDISYWGEQGVDSPFAPKPVSKLYTAISSVLKEKYRSEKPDGLVHIESCYLLANEETNDISKIENPDCFEETTVYLIVYHMKYKIHEMIEEVEGDFVPTAITFSVDENGEYTLKDYWTPRAGENYESDIRAKFPGTTADEALNIEKYAETLTNASWIQATGYLRETNDTSAQ